jgi:molybdopterin-guanine dinucleotide biosynthesis protein A
VVQESPPLGCTGVVLAGGAGSRLGLDKALLRVDGVRLVDRAVATLAVVCDRVLLAAGDRPLLVTGSTTIPDAVPGAGPLSAILGALENAGTADVAVLAVDHVAPDPAVLLHLRARRGDADVALCEVDGRLQPLHAVWSVSAAPAVRRRLDVGERSVHGVLRDLRLVVVDAAELRSVGLDVGFALDVDTPDDLEALGVEPPA